MKNLWLKIKRLFGYKDPSYGQFIADAYLYGTGIARVEPEEFYAVSAALDGLRNQAIDNTKVLDSIPNEILKYWIEQSQRELAKSYSKHLIEDWQDDAAKNLPIDVEEVKRHVKAARKHKKARRKKHGK